MAATSLIDTNVLVYRFDVRFPEKQAIASRLLREGLKTDSVRIPHQAVLEFMAVVTRVKIGSHALLSPADALVPADLHWLTVCPDTDLNDHNDGCWEDFSWLGKPGRWPRPSQNSAR